MQIHLGPSRNSPNLAVWRGRELWESIHAHPKRAARIHAREREVGQESPGKPVRGGLHSKLAAAILRYEIFPPELVSGHLAQTPVSVGDTVGTCYHFLPGLDLFFASRVIDCFDGEQAGKWRTGFTYSTLKGHPVMGAETFSVEKDLLTGNVTVALRSWSKPVTCLARALKPLCHRLQDQAVRLALDHLTGIATS